jgi:hypothetical protein
MLRERPSEFLYFCRFKAGSCDPALLRDAYTALGIENAVFSRYQERRVRDLLSRSEFRRNFTRGLEKLAQTDCIRDGSLGAAFTLDPANTLIALEALGRTDGVEKYIDKSGRIDFCSLPPCYQFMFSNYEIASTFAIRNVIALIKISQNQVKSYTYHEGRNDPALDGTGLPPRQECLYPLITFADGDEIVLSRGTDESLSRVYLPYSPVKFLSPDNLVGGKTGNQVIKGSRPLVIVASPSLCETLDVVEALKAARDAEPKPLTVLALRQPSNGLAEDLKNLGFKVGIRNEEDRKIGDYICEGKSFLDFDIVILNTRGELKNMFVEADIVIMGEDRNLAEPINSEFCPKILGFGGSWTVNQHAKIFAEETGRLTIVTSETIADALVNSLNEVASRQPDFSAAKEFRAYLEPFKRALGFQYGWVLAAAAIEFQDSLDRELAQLEKMGNEHSLACVNPDKVQ